MMASPSDLNLNKKSNSNKRTKQKKSSITKIWKQVPIPEYYGNIIWKNVNENNKHTKT